MILQFHHGHPPSRVTQVEARLVGADPHWLQLRWRVEGSSALVLPSAAGRGRADGLWQTTCFELFLKPEGGAGYVEFNLSPSQRWNAYLFDDYRQGMRAWDVPRAPVCTMRAGSTFAIFDAAIPRGGLPAEPCAMGLSAVIEEQGGAKSYWALAHPETGAPDFHHAACFASRLEAPRAP